MISTFRLSDRGHFLPPVANRNLITWPRDPQIMLMNLLPIESVTGLWEMLCCVGTLLATMLIWVCNLR